MEKQITILKQKNMEKQITIEYRPHLGDFLDENNVKWRNTSIEHVGDFITIYGIWENTFEDGFELAYKYMLWRMDNNL